MKSNNITSGNIKAIHSPKSIPMFNPAGSLSACRAIALGGVPIGVAIPPRLAAIGMLIVSAVRPFPLAGSAAKTGVRKVSIMAAVAVLLTNMENMPVISRKPRSTFSLFWPNGRIKFLANNTSNPDLVAAIARIKPPKNSMITGLAKVAIMSLLLNNLPNISFSSPLKNEILLLETVRHITVIMAKEVAHAGIASVSHVSVANTKMAIIRCCTTVRPSISNTLVGRFHTIAVTMMMHTSSISFFISKWLVNTFPLSSVIVFNVC